MACELLARMAMLALDGPARRWGRERFLVRLFSAGRLVHGGRRLRLRLAARWPWNQLISTASPGSRR